MRRSDREVTDAAHIEEIIGSCPCLRIGFCDDGEVYIVPLNFGYELKDGSYIFYFHGTKEGRKADLIRKSPSVGFEMDGNFSLIGADVACGWSARFQSVIGTGEVREITDIEEKRRALSLIMEHNTNKKDWDFDEKMLDAVMVFALIVTSLSCKEHL